MTTLMTILQLMLGDVSILLLGGLVAATMPYRCVGGSVAEVGVSRIVEYKPGCK